MKLGGIDVARKGDKVTYQVSKASRSESDKVRLLPEMDALLADLIVIDPARAMVLCG